MIIRTLDDAEAYCRSPKFLNRYFGAMDRLARGEIKTIPDLCEAVGLADEAAGSWMLYGFSQGFFRPGGKDAAGREVVKVKCGEYFRTLFVERQTH